MNRKSWLRFGVGSLVFEQQFVSFWTSLVGNVVVVGGVVAQQGQGYDSPTSRRLSLCEKRLSRCYLRVLPCASRGARGGCLINVTLGLRLPAILPGSRDDEDTTFCSNVREAA